MKSGGGRNKLQLETLLADNLSHKRFLSGRWSRKYKRHDFKRTKRTLDSEVFKTPFETIFPSCDISPNLSVEYSHKTSGYVCYSTTTTTESLS